MARSSTLLLSEGLLRRIGINMGNIVDFNTFNTLSLLRNSVKWFKENNKDGMFDPAIKVEEGAYQEYLRAARS